MCFAVITKNETAESLKAQTEFEFELQNNLKFLTCLLQYKGRKCYFKVRAKKQVLM